MIIKWNDQSEVFVYGQSDYCLHRGGLLVALLIGSIGLLLLGLLISLKGFLKITIVW